MLLKPNKTKSVLLTKQRTFEEGRAYKERVILEAQGKTAKFAEILPEYQRAPQVTRERLFIDTLQDVYSNTPKVFVDVNGSNNVLYLPLDRLLQQRNENLAQQPREDDDGPQSAIDKPNQGMSSLSRNISRRPTYEDAERPSRNGA